jgi:hypothetical protein
MAVRLEGLSKLYHPKDSDEVRCEVHGIVTTWGDLDSFQRMACEEGLDTVPELRCLLAPKQNGQEAER